jgi:hypothetical protein
LHARRQLRDAVFDELLSEITNDVIARFTVLAHQLQMR